MSTFEATDLCVEYPDKLLFADVDLVVRDDEFVAIETQVLDGGTSLLRALGGFLRGVKGACLLDGTDLLQATPADRAIRVGYVYANEGLVSLYSVYDNITLPLEFHTILTDEQIDARNQEVCKLLDIDMALMDQRPHELNDVQTRFVNLARALIIRPRLLLIDELEGGMSEEYLSATMTALRQWQSQHPMAVIITTSNDYVMGSADTVYRIENGHLERER